MELTQPKTILRKLSVNPDSFHLTTSFCSKTESCVFFPKIPRAWIPNGLLVVPCLNEKNIKGSFDLEVYASEKIFLNALPETYSRSIAGDWVDSASGGNHLNATWKKNPKFTLKFHYPVHSEDSAHVRITLARVGTNWRSQSKRDTVGCMIDTISIKQKNSCRIMAHPEIGADLRHVVWQDWPTTRPRVNVRGVEPYIDCAPVHTLEPNCPS